MTFGGREQKVQWPPPPPFVVVVGQRRRTTAAFWPRNVVAVVVVVVVVVESDHIERPFSGARVCTDDVVLCRQFVSVSCGIDEFRWRTAHECLLPWNAK